MFWKGEGKKLEDVDIPRIGHRLGVGEDELHAVMDVEARNSGFDSKGRVVMLFEPHIFWRQLGDTPERAKAYGLGLAYPKWRRNYPKDSYPRFEQALQINERAAFRSASWGLGQIMGFNCSLAGFDSAKEMIAAFAESEANQLEGMASFIESAGLDDELRAHDWRGFARGYNGSGYEANGYHTKLKARYDWWSNVPDTEWSPDLIGSVNPVDVVEPEEQAAEMSKPWWARILGGENA